MTTIICAAHRRIRVDDADADLAAVRWFVNSNGYAIADGASEYGLGKMHRVIMQRALGRPLGRHEMVDHIDGNRLNNRRGNLRVLSNHENGHNRVDLNANNTTGYRGVYPARSERNPWMAVITINRRRQYLGVYPTPEAAAAAYDRAAAQLVGHVNRGNRP